MGSALIAGVKQQFNVNLDNELVRRIKHHAIDAQLSLSDLISQVLIRHLQGSTTMSNPGQTGTAEDGNTQGTSSRPAKEEMVLQPLVHVRDTAGTVALLEVLGGRVEHGSRDGDFVLVNVGGAQVGLLAHPPNPEQGEGDVELTFATTRPLKEVEQAARAGGVDVAQPTTDEGFGRQLQLRTPEGLLVKVDQLQPELYS